MYDPTRLPDGLPVPTDDGACDHLLGHEMPDLALPSTAGGEVALRALPGPRTIIYIYPRTGLPGVEMPDGWDAIPGARGCTPQSCSFRDHAAELAKRGATVFGLSTQATDYQLEMAERLHLPFAVLSDADFRLAEALRLPTFEIAGMRLLKRATLIVRGTAIEDVLYPVFPPNQSAAAAVAWLDAHPLA